MARTFVCPNSGCPFRHVFSCLEPSQFRALRRARMGRHYDRGEVVFLAETLALAVYCIHAGRVRLTRPTKSGKLIGVGVRGAGDVLGFREALVGLPYQVVAEAITPSMICEVPREAFLRVVRDNVELAHRLMQKLAVEYIGTEAQLVLRADLDVPTRIAHLLNAKISERVASEGRLRGARVVRMGREEMAVLVGSTRESVSRSLRKLSLQQIIRIENGAIHVLDPEGLQHLID